MAVAASRNWRCRVRCCDAAEEEPVAAEWDPLATLTTCWLLAPDPLRKVSTRWAGRAASWQILAVAAAGCAGAVAGRGGRLNDEVEVSSLTPVGDQAMRRVNDLASRRAASTGSMNPSPVFSVTNTVVPLSRLSRSSSQVICGGEECVRTRGSGGELWWCAHARVQGRGDVSSTKPVAVGDIRCA